MFAICLGRIEFREMAEIHGSCGAKKSLQWVLAIQSVTRFTARDAWDGAAFIDQSGCRARIGDSLRTEWQNRIGVGVCRAENRKNVRL